jgi:vitamin B12 transporter
MTPILILAAAVAADSGPPIIVNATLIPQAADQVSATTTVILENQIAALGEPLVSDLLRLTPGLSVSPSGGPGSLVQIRVRGAEANHTLLFIDGIEFNDPASADEARFESLTSYGLGRIEVIRGPQSALFGSEALGGVIALDSPDPLGKPRASAEGSYGSLDTRQASAMVVSGGDKAGITASGSWIKSDGIDILGGGHGDKDGYENKTFSFKAIARPGVTGEFGLVGRYIDYRDQFDGTDPNTFLRADTLDNSHATTKAIRGWATLGRDPNAPWSGTLEAQYLTSDNRNFTGHAPLNTTSGDRLRISAQGISRFAIGGSRHNFILRLEREDENFRASDIAFGGATNQQRNRGRTTVIGEWKGSFGALLDTDLAVRHDDFSDFKDSTTVRAGAVVHVTRKLALTGSYGDGIAQPTFNDLFGFFPGSYVGNPNLKPERSRGFEAGVRWRSPRLDVTLTGFSNRLTDEIVSVFGPAPDFLGTAANADGKSRRRGIELSAEWRPLPGLAVDGDYTYLDANEQKVSGGARLHEVRRPKHSANLSATYSAGRLTLAGGVAYVGKRFDTDFDIPFPLDQNVTLHSYALVSARVAYRVLPMVELFVRGDNLGGAHYQDLAGYATAGRTVYGGVRVAFGE